MLPMVYKQENPRELGKDLEAIRKEMVALEAEQQDCDAKDQVAYERLMADKARRFEMTLESLANGYLHVCEANKLWRKAIFCGELLLDADAERNYRSMFAEVGLLCDHMKEKAQYYERHGADFQGSLELLEQCSRDARQTYLTWVSPRLSTSPALRTLYVSGDELAKARALFAK